MNPNFLEDLFPQATLGFEGSSTILIVEKPFPSHRIVLTPHIFAPNSLMPTKTYLSIYEKVDSGKPELGTSYITLPT